MREKCGLQDEQQLYMRREHVLVRANGRTRWYANTHTQFFDSFIWKRVREREKWTDGDGEPAVDRFAVIFRSNPSKWILCECVALEQTSILCMIELFSDLNALCKCCVNALWLAHNSLGSSSPSNLSHWILNAGKWLCKIAFLQTQVFTYARSPTHT